MKQYDVTIIGGGASGTALLYILSKYTDIENICIIEKYNEFGSVNSNGRNNSQSLHIGDIEMHYTRKKAEEVKRGALMIPSYVSTLPESERSLVMKKTQKMALAVGQKEVADMKKRIEEFDGLFPTQKVLSREEIAFVEPNIVEGRSANEELLALYEEDGHIVDYGRLAQSFVKHAQEEKDVDVFLGKRVEKLTKKDGEYKIKTNKQTLHSRSVVVDTDSYSLLFAKQLGLGKEYSLIPIGASFYYSPPVLKGKVYPMQDKKLPFAGVHGDPDITKPDTTRWGPTATFYPVLESGKLSTMPDYLSSAGLTHYRAFVSFLKILLDPTRFFYLLKSALYDLPIVGKYLFVKNVQKIVPSIKASDLIKAKGVGGMRLQRVNVTTGELELGEGKIIDDNIIFNMTPSPGASVCLYNAVRDTKTIVGFLKDVSFDEERLGKDFS